MTFDELPAKKNTDMELARETIYVSCGVNDAMRHVFVGWDGVTSVAIRPEDIGNSTALHTDEVLKDAIAYARDQERSRILAAIQSCAPSDVPYSAAKHE